MKSKPPRQLYKWDRARVKLARPAGNMMASLPAGTEGEVRKRGRGLEFTSDACECCGVQVRISRMSRDDFELIELAEQFKSEG
ncbi:hypothetical protein MWG95_11880 [Klebsiella variicola]|uniref:hypothetical protein n=1 Tax=Klebsiella variicola TaxID=244366 RepID=UPI001FF20C3A|nr:hypothetical protein [Klebsiella variicola]MCJ8541418.1 hypothetical protein [Klebsiella variicola]